MKKNLVHAWLIIFLLVNFQSASPAFAGKVDYTLPYPGILPDSPLYTFKTIRDSLEGFFIGDPIKKAEFDLNHADMYVAAAETLTKQKKDTALIETSLKKALAYFRSGLEGAREAKMQGMDINSTTKKFMLSNRKHREVIDNISSGKNFESLKKEGELLGREAEKMRPK